MIENLPIELHFDVNSLIQPNRKSFVINFIVPFAVLNIFSIFWHDLAYSEIIKDEILFFCASLASAAFGYFYSRRSVKNLLKSHLFINKDYIEYEMKNVHFLLHWYEIKSFELTEIRKLSLDLIKINLKNKINLRNKYYYCLPKNCLPINNNYQVDLLRLLDKCLEEYNIAS